MWFTEENVDQIGSIDMFGQITEFGMATAGCCFPTGIAAGPGGNTWYTLEIGDLIGQITAGGLFTQHPIQTVQVLAWDIAPGPDGTCGYRARWPRRQRIRQQGRSRSFRSQAASPARRHRDRLRGNPTSPRTTRRSVR
jgi:hypothetical protein